MNGPIYKFYRMRWTAEWYALSKTEQDALLAKNNGLATQFGVKTLLFCNSSWSNERWLGSGVEEYPDMGSVQKYNAALQEIEWFRYAEGETMLGTAWPTDA